MLFTPTYRAFFFILSWKSPVLVPIKRSSIRNLRIMLLQPSKLEFSQTIFQQKPLTNCYIYFLKFLCFMNPVFFLSRLGVYLSIFRACASQFFQREYICGGKEVGVFSGRYPTYIHFVQISFVIAPCLRIKSISSQSIYRFP